MNAKAKTTLRSVSASGIAARVDAIDWAQIESELDTQGCAIVKRLFSADECRALSALYPDDAHFRSRIVMGRHGFGRGEYKYFSYPLPDLIAQLRPVLYRRLGRRFHPHAAGESAKARQESLQCRQAEPSGMGIERMPDGGAQFGALEARDVVRERVASYAARQHAFERAERDELGRIVGFSAAGRAR